MSAAASDILGDYYTRAAKRLSELVLHPHGGTDRSRKFTAARAGILAKQADDLGRALKSYTATWTGRELADRVTQGIRAAEQEALVLGVPRPPGAPVTGSFATLDRRAVETLAADTAGTLYRAADSMTARTKSILRQTAQAELSEGDINRILAGGVIDGMPQATWRSLRDELEAAHGGKLVTVIDRNGRPMEFDAGKYARMVAITKTREAVEVGRQGRLVELGIELVSIVGRLSKHFCTAFLGQVFYIGSGSHPKYPHLDTLPGGGPPFHPNCSKSTRAYVEGLASDAQQQAAPGVPDARKLIGMDATNAQRAYQALQLRQQVEPVVRTLTPVEAHSRDGVDPYAPFTVPPDSLSRFRGQQPPWVHHQGVNEDLQEGFATIAAVHGPGFKVPPLVTKVFSPSDPRVQGSYNSGVIRVATTARTPILTAAHEFGHHIVSTLYNGSVAGRRELDDWWSAVKQSSSYIQLRGVSDDLTAIRAAGGQVNLEGLNSLIYSLHPNEIFSRSYAQWIATMGPSQRLKAELDARRRSHWSDSDFEPIAASMNKLFGKQ